jgi:hypothetical protein
MFFIFDVAKKREEIARKLFAHDVVKIKRIKSERLVEKTRKSDKTPCL